MRVEFQFEERQYTVEYPDGVPYYNIALPDGRLLRFEMLIMDASRPHFVGMKLSTYSLEEAKKTARGIRFGNLETHVANTPVATEINKEG